MIEWSKLEPRFGDWADSFKPFHDGGGFETIFSFLKSEGKNKKIVPESPDLFRAFKECPRKELKAVIVGQNPYPAIKAGKIVADGLAFSCSHTKEEQPSLRLFFDAVEKDLFDGFSLEMIREPNLKYLAEQGVLLLNSSLTYCPAEERKKHTEIWRPFMNHIFQSLGGVSGIPFIFMGEQAQEYAYLVDESMNYIKNIEHPASAYGRPWEHHGCFNWVNEILKKNNNLHIDWVEQPPF